MRIYALANQKGGCGKTTTAIHLAAALHARGRRVLLVDLDPQAHATLGVGCYVGHGSSLIEVLQGELPAANVLRHLRAGLELLPASLALAEFEEEAVQGLAPERALEAALVPLADRFDVAVLDCPPRADGVLTANALRAATHVMLVVETGAFALQGALRAREIFETLLADSAQRPELRVLATMFDRRTRFARDVLIAMQARFGGAMYETAIRSSVLLREAVASGTPALWSAPESRPALDFFALADEVLAGHVLQKQ
jgi:chromosome partitioning protein